MSKTAKKNVTTRDASEIAQFDALGEDWWDENGPMKPLHRLNPTRLEYIRDQICAHYKHKNKKLRPLTGLKIADIGCGGGLVTEPLCRMGANVTGVDAGEENIKVAKAHAKKHGLKINYLATTSEDLAATGKKYDVVTALEIIEHVADPKLFIESCCNLVKKDGIIILSTLNKTAKSFALGIVAAEYIMRWLPRGTHDWRKFMRPSQMARRLAEHEFKTVDVTGLVYNPLSREFSLNDNDLDVNYLLTAIK